VIEDAEMEKNVAPHSCATAFPISVLPVPTEREISIVHVPAIAVHHNVGNTNAQAEARFTRRAKPPQSLSSPGGPNSSTPRELRVRPEVKRSGRALGSTTASYMTLLAGSRPAAARQKEGRA
jgi:hypothetical protein